MLLNDLITCHCRRGFLALDQTRTSSCQWFETNQIGFYRLDRNRPLLRFHNRQPKRRYSPKLERNNMNF